MRDKLGMLLAAGAVLLFGLVGPASADSVDDGFGAADAGTFGVAVDDGLYTAYCLADAGSFGIENPLSVC